MDSDVYNQIYEYERKHWWSRGMSALCNDLINKHVPASGAASRVILDVGCGTGLWAQQLLGRGRVIAMDNATESLDICRRRGLRNIVKCDAESLAIAGYSCDLVTALGVAEHLDDDAALLREIARVLKSGGYAVFLTSAYMFLWSEHDEAAHHKRRYTREQLKTAVSGSGLEVVRISYVNFFLFLPILVARLLKSLAGRRGAPSKGSPDIFLPPPFLNGLLYAVLRFESWLLNFSDLPFGVGLFAVVRKK
jgi:SAM-dependent methyltransferase